MGGGGGGGGGGGMGIVSIFAMGVPMPSLKPPQS